MRAQIKYLIKQFSLVVTTILLAAFCTTGCTTSKIMWAKFWFSGGSASKPAPDPLASWKFKPFPGWEAPPFGHNTNHLDGMVVNDYEKFIADNHLDLFGAVTGFYEDGTGQHAVEFTAFPPNQNVTWNYVLFYDKNNKRIRVVRYDHIKYQS